LRVASSDFKKGWVKIRVDNADDLWYLKQIIESGDYLSGKTSRRVQITEKKTDKKIVFLKIVVEKIEFHVHSTTLRVSGKVVEGPEEVELNSYHTFNIKPGSVFKLEKEEWRDYQVKKIREAVLASKQPKAILVSVDAGEAEVALIKNYGVESLPEYRFNLPRKSDASYENAKKEFYKGLIRYLLNLMKSKDVNKVIVGGNFVVVDDFKKSLSVSGLSKEELGSFIVTSISSSGRGGVQELIKRGFVERVIKESRVNKETLLVEEALKRLSRNERVAYGFKEVSRAVSLGAVDTLLVSDSLIQEFRETNKFGELESLMKACERAQGVIEIISSEHEAGKKLKHLTGIIALLRYEV